MGKLVSVNFAKNGGKAPPARSKKRRKVSLATSLWSILFIALSITFLIVEGTLLMVLALVAGLFTVLSAVNDFKGQPPVPVKAAPKAKTAVPRGSSRTAPAKRKPGTATRKRTCSARCRASSKPASTCNCICSGTTHGVKHRSAS